MPGKIQIARGVIAIFFSGLIFSLETMGWWGPAEFTWGVLLGFFVSLGLFLIGVCWLLSSETIGRAAVFVSAMAMFVAGLWEYYQIVVLSIFLWIVCLCLIYVVVNTKLWNKYKKWLLA